MRRLSAALLLLALPLLALPSLGDEPEPKTATGKSEEVYDSWVHEEYRVPTAHGTIYGVVRRPVVDEGVKVPVILTYSPYNALSRPVAAQTGLTDAIANYFVPRGYARAVFDLVGTRESSGCYDHGGIRERETAHDVVEFLGTQEWSNGKVGMIGGSYDGTTQWAAAVESPPHLTTIVPQVAIGRWYDYAYGQGVRFYSGNGTPALFDFGFGFLPPTGVTDPVAWAEALQDHLNPCERVEHNDRAFLPDPVYDEYWDERDYLARIDKVKASVLIVGSWKDYNVHPVNSIEMWDALPASHPKRLVMGQKGHSGAQMDDSRDIEHAWFDHWLLGLDTGVMDLPAVDSDTNTADRFQSSSWPPAETVDVSLTLGRGEAARGAVGLEGDLEIAEWTDEDPVLSEDDVLDRNAEGKAVIFLGPELAERVRISGTPVLEALVTTSGESTHLTPVLFDQDENGDTEVVTRGLLNSRNRDSLRESTPLKPGEQWPAEVVFQPVDWVLEEGHRLGLAVMSMNQSEALYADTVRSTNEIALDGASRLVVPVSRGVKEMGGTLVAPQPAPPAPVPPVVRPAPPKAAPPRRTLPATGAEAPLLAVVTVAAAALLRRRLG